jgi:hypothetical protein
MKNSLLLFCFLISLGSNAQPSKNYRQVLKSIQCPFPVHFKSYSSHAGFCDRIFYINDDSTFTETGGCENHQFLLFGNWRNIGDSVELITSHQIMSTPICTIDYVAGQESVKQTTISINDKTGKPANHFLILPIEINNEHTFSSDWLTPQMSDPKKNIYTDSLGKAFITDLNADSLDLRLLSMLTGRNIRLSAKRLPSEINIVLNFNYDRELEFADELNCDNYFIKPLRFKKTDSQLIRKNWILDVLK